MADKNIGELPLLQEISSLDLLVAQHNSDAMKITGKVLTDFFKKYIGPSIAKNSNNMTDYNKVYVYVGAEQGYTFGNWYYYNGSSWVSGGAYNSQATNTDASLTHAGIPADAEATGKILEVSPSQPSSPGNRVWIEETPSAVQVPTWAEFEALQALLNSRTDTLEIGSISKGQNIPSAAVLDQSTCYKVGTTCTVGARLHTMSFTASDQNAEVCFRLPVGFWPPSITRVMGYVYDQTHSMFAPAVATISSNNGYVTFALGTTNVYSQIAFYGTYSTRE